MDTGVYVKDLTSFVVKSAIEIDQVRVVTPGPFRLTLIVQLLFINRAKGALPSSSHPTATATLILGDASW